MRKLTELDNLIHTNRFSGKRLLIQESVSDHLWCMNSLAFEYIPIMNGMLDKWDESHRKCPRISIQEVIYKIAIHDLDEAFYCDIPRTFKYHNDEVLKAINDTADKLITSKMGSKMAEEVSMAKDKKSVTGLIVKILDSAQAGFKMKSEVLLGNRYFENEIPDCLGVLHHVREIVENSTDLIKGHKEVLLWLIDEVSTEIKTFEVE